MEFHRTYPILQSLRDQWQTARKGAVTLCAVTSPYGATAQRLSAQFQNEISVEALTWEITLTAHDTGSHIIPKIISGLHRALQNAPQMQSALLNRIRQTVGDSKDETEIYQLTIFRDALHLLKLSEGKTLVFPDHTPLLTLVRCIQFVAENFPTLIWIQQADQSHSMALFTILQMLVDQSDDDQRMCILLNFSTVTPNSRYRQPLGLLSLITDSEASVYDIAPLSDTEITATLSERGSQLTTDVAKWWTGGAHSMMADLLDWETSDTRTDLMRKSLPNLSEDSEFIVSLAALLGWRFTLAPLSRLSGQSEDALIAILKENSEWIESNTARPDSRKAYAFTRYLNWFHLRRYVASTQPQFANLVAQNIETFYPHDRQLLAAAAEIRVLSDVPELGSIARGMQWAFEDNSLWFELVVLVTQQKLLWPEEAWETGFLSAFQYCINERPEEAQNTFDAARECFRKLDRPHAEIQLLCVSGNIATEARDLEVMMDHFQSAIDIAVDNQDIKSNVGTRLRYAEALILLDEPRQAMVQLTLIEELDQTPQQLTERMWLTGQLAEQQSDIELALNLYQNARQLAVEHRHRRISAAAGLSMLPLLIQNVQPDSAQQLFNLLQNEVQGDSELEKQWEAAKSYFV